MPDLPFVLNGSQHTFQFNGPFPTGTQLTLHWDRTQVDVPCGPFNYAMNWYADGVRLIFSSNFSGFNSPHTLTTTLDQPAAFTQGSFWVSSYCSAGTVFNLTQATTGGPGNCQFGTERNPAVAPITYVTASVIGTWANLLGATWLTQFLVQLVGQTLDADLLCQSPPPPVPVIPANPLEISATQARKLLEFVAWYSLCQCKAGSPAPIPYPPPTLTQPIGTPTPPTFPCANTDVCAAITRIEQAIYAISQTLGQNYELTTLLQRYGLPFANINGATHPNLVGSAAFAISRLVGMRVSITGLDGEHRTLEGSPEYIWDLGWMSIGDADGMWQEQRITRLSQQWFPLPMPMATTFGYFLKAGVSASFQEIEAEP